MADTKVKRTVSGVFVQYRSVEEDLLGNKVLVMQTADRGEEIELDPREAERLEQAGMLAPEGTSREEIVAAVHRRSEAHAALRRALNPADNVLAVDALPNAPESVSPPSLGAAPRGEIVTGDTGRPDQEPAPGAATESEGEFRADAPDVENTTELAAFINEEKLTVPQTVALAEGEPARAAAVLEAEKVATNGQPRAGVVKELEPLAGSSE